MEVDAESKSIASSALELVAKASRLQPASEFLQIPKRQIWTERIFKAEGWSKGVLIERSGDLAGAMLHYILSVGGKKGLARSPQWAALSLFNAAVVAHRLNSQALQNRMLRLAAILYERAFEPLLSTFPEAAVWTSNQSARCYMLTGDVDNATRMLQFAEKIQQRLCPLQRIILDVEDLADLPGPISGSLTIQLDLNILKNIEEELEIIESAIELR